MNVRPEGALILAVEDDLGLAELIREEITLRGWGFLHAGTGAAAIELLGRTEPDLVLLDFSLPDMTALQLLERAHVGAFIVTTGSGDERIAVEMMKKGARDYLVKDAHFLGSLPGAVERALAAVDTERRLQETQVRLKEADEQLRTALKMESLGRMAGGIAHDFNNLFQAIQGNLEMAADPALDPAAARAAAARALRVLEKASGLARQMLDFTGKGFLQAEALDLGGLVRETLEEVRAASGRDDVRLEAEPGLPPVEGDPAQLRQVVAGLVSNAREAQDRARGPVDVRVGRLLPGDLEGGRWIHRPEGGDPMVCLEVGDQGPGMTPEILDRAFDPFFTTHRPGRGLGLSAALGILKAHGAGLWVSTAPGAGTLIRVLLHPCQGTLPGLSRPAAAPCSGRRTILLVDDDEDLQETLAEYLRDALGYDLIQARDGVEAVEAWRRAGSRVGLILMDATMPRMTGPEAFRLIREMDPSARAVLCSGFAQEAGARVAQEGGFLGFLKKPFSLQVLRETVRAHIPPRD
ncbi:MAG TPA: response regulator [Holophaga sp.]|nr:response regulator [Holophaga sp.]